MAVFVDVPMRWIVALDTTLSDVRITGTPTEDIETFGRAVRQRDGRLRDRGGDGVVGRDDIRPPAAEIRIVVRKHRGHVTEPQSVEGLERELLQVVAEREPAAADRLGPVGENRTEALRRSHERAGRRVERIGETGGGDGIGARRADGRARR
jgi:hypothetical protein